MLPRQREKVDVHSARRCHAPTVVAGSDSGLKGALAANRIQATALHPWEVRCDMSDWAIGDLLAGSGFTTSGAKELSLLFARSQRRCEGRDDWNRP